MRIFDNTHHVSTYFEQNDWLVVGNSSPSAPSLHTDLATSAKKFWAKGTVKSQQIENKIQIIQYHLVWCYGWLVFGGRSVVLCIVNVQNTTWGTCECARGQILQTRWITKRKQSIEYQKVFMWQRTWIKINYNTNKQTHSDAAVAFFEHASRAPTVFAKFNVKFQICKRLAEFGHRFVPKKAWQVKSPDMPFMPVHI